MVGILSSVVRSVKGERSARKHVPERPPVQHRKSWMQSLSNLSQVFAHDAEPDAPDAATSPKRTRFPSFASFSSKHAGDGTSLPSRAKGDTHRSLASRVRPISVSLGFAGHKRGASAGDAYGSVGDTSSEAGYAPSPLGTSGAGKSAPSHVNDGYPRNASRAAVGNGATQKPSRPSTAPAGARLESQVETSALAARMGKLRGMEAEAVSAAAARDGANVSNAVSTLSPSHARPAPLDRQPSADSASVYTQSTAQEDYAPSPTTQSTVTPTHSGAETAHGECAPAKSSPVSSKGAFTGPASHVRNANAALPPVKAMSLQPSYAMSGANGYTANGRTNGVADKDHEDYIAVDIPTESPFAGWSF
ncbi:hypothetical protein HDZ31DRAFT_85712 [Schizophyllum fasciatum]